jgi:uncharacterized repeat protein (TIGR01451 family)
MPIRRSALSLICLVLFGSAALQGQQNDPFAEWDRQQSKSSARKVTAKDPKASVTYFSPSSEEAVVSKPAAAPAEPSKKVLMRERSAATTPAKSALQKSAAGNTAAKAVIPQAASKQNVAGTKAVSSKTPASQTQTAESKSTAVDPEFVTKSAEVKDASFSSETSASTRGDILRVNHMAADEAEEANPFEDFLKVSQESPEDEANTNTFDESTEDVAEPLFNAKAKSPSGRPVPAKPSTAERSSAVKPVSVTRTATPGARNDSGPQSPGVTVQWIRRGDFNVGQECDVDLVVQNTSKVTVQSVMTEAVIPPAVEVVEAVPSPIEGSDSPTWTFGELKPGEKRTVAIKMIPRERGDVRLDAYVRLTGFSSTEFAVQEPMIAVEVVGPAKIEMGQQAGYVVRVNNPGTGVASNVIIQAAIPAGLEHRSGSILSIEIGTLNPGESRQAKLSVTAIKGGPQELAIRAIADGELSDETMAQVAVAEPQLKIAISGPEEQMAGRKAEYKMAVSNAGNVQSANVRAKYRIPEGAEFIAADRGGKYNKADHSIEWFVGTLQPEETSDFQLTLLANETGELLHQAGVISEHGQVTMCDYASMVEGTAALDLKIVATEKAPQTGDEIVWEVRIRNTGSRAADSVGLSCELPSGIQIIDADGPSEYIADNGIMVFRSIAAIAPDEEVLFKITARCLREGNHRLRIRVASESVAEPVIGEEIAAVSDR